MKSTSSAHAELIATSKAINTDWFSADLVPSDGQLPGEMYKFTFMINCPTSTVVNCIMTISGSTVTAAFNGGVALAAASWYSFDVLVPDSTTAVNIQHATSTQNVTCICAETKTAMVG